jgi:hypothetical protein
MLTAPSALLLIQAIATGSIAGTLRDATTNDPLSGAQLVVVDLNRTAVTDADGRYRLDRLPAGTHRLLVRRIGYAPRTLDALVPADGAIEIMIVLRAEPIVLGAIDGAYRATESSPTDPHVDLAALRTHPLLAEPDAFQALSGGVVAVRPEAPAGMHVRGGGSDQVAYLLDGFPIFSPYHSGEAFSAWNPDALAGADLVPASETWDALSGVVSATSRAPGRQHHAQAGISTTHMRLTLDGPLGGGSRGAGYLWSQRSGFPGFPMPQHESTYLRSETGDQLGKLEASLAGGRLRLLGYGTANELDTDGPAGTASRNTFNWQSTTIGGEWNKSGRASFFLARAWIASGEASATWHVDSSADLLASRRRDAGASVTLERNDKGGHTAVGVRVQTSRMAYQVTSYSGHILRYDSHAPLAALFLERAQRLDARTGLTTAINATASGGAARLSPRVRLSWIPSSGLVLSGDVMRLYQFAQSLHNPESVAGAVFPVDLFVGASRSGVPIARSDEVIVAAAYRPAAGLRLSAQGYARAFHDVVLVAPNSQDPFATGSLDIGSGIARGVSIDLSHTTARYTVFAVYGRQSVRFAYGTRSYVPEYGASDAADAGVMIHPSRALSLRLGASGRFGRHVTPLTTPFEWESCNVADRGCEFAGSPRTNRDSLGATTLPGYVRVDLGIRNAWQLRIAGRTTDFAVFGTLTNVFARSNALTMAPDPVSGVRTPVTLRSRAPLVIGLDWTF